MEIKIPNLQKIKINRKNFSGLPQTPGIYIFFSQKKPIYIGKSVNLKSRLSSYLEIRNVLPKTAKMLNSAEYVSFIKVDSELEALLLEAKLINKYKPVFNVVAKDDKHPLYIVITKEEFPRILALRQLNKNNMDYIAKFGPFPSSKNVKGILSFIRRLIPYSDHKIGKKTCIYSQIGLCNPCPSFISSFDKNEAEYIKLKKQYINQIRQIKFFLEGRFGTIEKKLRSEMNIFSKKKEYEKAAILRDKIKQFEYITQPKFPVSSFLENPNFTKDVRSKEINKLNSFVNKNNLNIKRIRRIECYDVSHISGVNPTASMVVAIDGEMENSEYKRFKIRQPKTQSDYDSLKEVAERRMKNDWPRPDLIIVDGGLGQVRVFGKIIKDIPIIGIAKNPDRIVFENGKKIRLEGDVKNLIVRLRDEAHRFAGKYHRFLMSKDLLTKQKRTVVY